MPFIFSSKKTVCYNKMTSVRKCCISKSVKNRKLLPTEKFPNILAFDKESKRKLLSLISSRDSFLKNNLYIWPLSWNFFYTFMENFLISKKLHSDVMDSQLQYMYSWRLWVKVFISQGWVQAEITEHTVQSIVNLTKLRTL